MSFLNLTNYRDHPVNERYIVFFFSDFQMANYFEELLVEEEIEYERAVEEETVKRYLFGVHRRYRAQAMELNNRAIGRFRKKFIPNNLLRWVILFITLVAVFLAILGYLRA